jgi:hypothetical protein
VAHLCPLLTLATPVLVERGEGVPFAVDAMTEPKIIAIHRSPRAA